MGEVLRCKHIELASLPSGKPCRSEPFVAETAPRFRAKPYAWARASSTAAWKPRRVLEAPEAMSMALTSWVSTISSQ